MGGTSSTRRVTFEADENENITVVKGIRVSDSGRAEGQGLHSDPEPLTSAAPAQLHSPCPDPLSIHSTALADPKPRCLQRSQKFRDSGHGIQHNLLAWSCSTY